MTPISTPKGAPLNRAADHHCFGCGDQNPHGLRLKFYRLDEDNGRVHADWVPTPTEEGYVGMVHGGLISTVCDEVMAWACYAQEIWGMTARLWGRMIELAAEMRDGRTGQLVADATAQFIRVSDDQSAAWAERYGGLEAD